MENLNFIESVTERDIDLLLLEEMTVSRDFFLWFLGKICNYQTKDVVGVWHSITDKRFGESDLAAIFTDIENCKYGLLIENKIDALAQPDQCGRYVQRGQIGIEQGFWQKFVVCLVAPSLYIRTNKEAERYQSSISYEEILDWFSSQQDLRSQYKAMIIRNAIEQNRRGYTVTPDDRVTNFWQKYFEVASINYPELEMSVPGPKPSESDWPEFRPKVFNKKMALIHKLQKGAVDLQINGMGDRIDELSLKISDLLPSDVEIVKTGKSAALRISVPTIDRFESFENQSEAIIIGFEAIVKLFVLAKTVLNRLQKGAND
jgi:hypothetical protein